jgi:iron(III) transport system ATP-binding protein
VSPAPLLELRDLACGYGQQRVVEQLQLSLQRGDIGCLLGPSGCGKTTTLRAIAGFEAVHEGSVLLERQVISRRGFSLAPEQRRIGMVFQDYALFPHLTVAENIAFGLGKSPNPAPVVAQMLELVNLPGLDRRYPHELSGGQQQRVALARALAPAPSLLLLDEPFSNLDVTLRKQLSLEVRDILKQRGTTAILVTHDQEEAFAVSDFVGVFNRGRLEQWDRPANLYHRPASRFVAQFIGQGYFIRGQAAEGGMVDTPLGRLAVTAVASLNASPGIDVLLRPDAIQPATDSDVIAQVVGQTFQGATTLYRLLLPDGTALQALFPSQLTHRVGDRVGIRLKDQRHAAFPAAA